MDILLGTELNANWFYVLMENAKKQEKQSILVMKKNLILDSITILFIDYIRNALIICLIPYAAIESLRIS